MLYHIHLNVLFLYLYSPYSSLLCCLPRPRRSFFTSSSITLSTPSSNPSHLFHLPITALYHLIFYLIPSTPVLYSTVSLHIIPFLHLSDLIIHSFFQTLLIPPSHTAPGLLNYMFQSISKRQAELDRHLYHQRRLLRKLRRTEETKQVDFPSNFYMLL
jgi:hypothetical protein